MDKVLSRKRFFIDSVGCTENIIDGAIIMNIAESYGLDFTKDYSQADLIIFNTCAFKQKQEDLCVEKLAHYQKTKKAGAEIIVCGCLTEINKERLKNTFQGLAFAPKNLDAFYTYLRPDKPPKIEEAHHITRDLSDSQMFGRRAFIENIYQLKRFSREKLHLNILPNFNVFDYIGDENTLYVRISRGCLNQCGYCAIRFAQGRLASQPMDSVLEVIQKGLSEGYKKIFLVGTNTSQYGKDIGTSFFMLLDNVLHLDGDFKVIIHNFEPHGIQEEPEKFLELLSSPKVLSFYFPLNSGSQYVLERMKRGYEIDEVMGTLRKLRKKNKNILIRSEFIVGYPGERWKNFRQTLSLILKFSFNQIDLHLYSPRPNVYSLQLDSQVPPLVKYLRFLIIETVVFFKVTLKKLRPI